MKPSGSCDSLQARAQEGGARNLVRVTIYSGGSVDASPASGGSSCEYVGGEIRACMIPHDCSYFELMHYLVEEKALGPCSIRYEAVRGHTRGGSELNKAELVSISSQDDLECALFAVKGEGRGASLRLFVDQCDETEDLLFVDDTYDGISNVGSEDLDELDAWMRDEDVVLGWPEDLPGEGDGEGGGGERTRSPWEMPPQAGFLELEEAEAASGFSPFDSQMEEVCNAIDRSLTVGPATQHADQPPQQPEVPSAVQREQRPRVEALSLLLRTPTAAAVEAAKRRPSPKKPIFLQKGSAAAGKPLIAAGEPDTDLCPVAADAPAGGSVSSMPASSVGSAAGNPAEADSDTESDDDAAEADATPPVGTIDAAELSNLRPFQRGGFGQIFVAQWHEMDVAVKALPHDMTHAAPSVLKSFKEEVRLLSRLRHPNIVLYLGTVRERNVAVLPEGAAATAGGEGGAPAAAMISERWRLVTEFVPRGSLYDVLRKTDPKRLTWRRRVEIAIGTSLGMHFLHTQGVAHMDLKSLNVLIGTDFTPKICDFGLCREGMISTNNVEGLGSEDGTGGEEEQPMGTFEWMAPEVMRCEAPRRSADVYSFGVMLWELCALDTPYRSVRNKRLLVHLVGDEGMRPPIPASCEDLWCGLMVRCWMGVPSERPSFQAVVAELREMRKVDMTGWAVQPPVETDQQDHLFGGAS